jgi:pimeloyl-ACP methyl ester carboxylesterase
MWRGPVTRRGRIAARVAFYSAVVFVALPLALSQTLLGTYRQPTGPPPAGWQELWLVSEGLKLRAWQRPGDPARAAALLVHGVGDTLESYQDNGEALHRRGHTVLLLDLRGHGKSEGRYMSLGARETQDVRAAIAHLKGAGLAPAGLLLSGVSMGAVSVLLAAAGRDDVRGVIAEAPFDSYRGTVAHHAWLFYRMPRWVPLLPLAVAMAEWRGGFDADQVDAVAAARRIRAPLLAIVDGADRRMPEPVVRRILDAHPGPKRLWVAPGAPHAGASLHPDYPRVVSGFLDENGL